MAFDYDKVGLALSRLLSKVKPEAVILFGSVARMEAMEDSDIDLLLIMDTEDTLMASVQVRKAIGIIGVPVDVLVYTPEEYAEKVSDMHSVVHHATIEGELIFGSV